MPKTLTVSLDGLWRCTQIANNAPEGVEPSADGCGFFAAEVPGEIHKDLIREKRLPNLFSSMEACAENEWVAENDWLYQKDFDLPKPLPADWQCHIHLDSVDTFADVFVNGELVGVSFLWVESGLVSWMTPDTFAQSTLPLVSGRRWAGVPSSISLHSALFQQKFQEEMGNDAQRISVQKVGYPLDLSSRTDETDRLILPVWQTDKSLESKEENENENWSDWSWYHGTPHGQEYAEGWLRADGQRPE